MHRSAMFDGLPNLAYFHLDLQSVATLFVQHACTGNKSGDQSINLITRSELLHKMISLILVFISVLGFATGAAYNSYQYDLTVPQFTPDGRLLQVEYASAAADHSSPILMARLNDDSMVMISTRAKNKVQERLILLPESDSIVAISGILADSLALLQKVQQESLNYKRIYGTPFKPQQMADVVATACQQHAFGGGLRCYGSTMVVAGCQDMSLVLLQSDPSGALQDLRRTDKTFQVIGGAAFQGGIKSSLQRRLETMCGSSAFTESAGTMAQRMASIVGIMIQEHEKSGKVSKDDLVFEVAVVSKSRGAYKLSSDQVAKLLALHSA